MPAMLDGVLESTTTTGTADLDLDGAQTGFESFSSAGAVSGRQYYYYIADSAAAPTLWERGVGTWTSGTPATLSRDRVLRSSSGTSKISLLSGTTYLVAAIDSVAAFQDADWTWLRSVSGTDTITAVGSPTLKAYAAGQCFRFVAAGANTGAVTLNVDSLGAKSVTKRGATALAAGDLPASAVVEVVYDGTRFQVTGLLGGVADATNGGISVTNGATLALNVADLSSATPTQASTLAFEAGSGSKKARLAGSSTSLIAIAAATQAEMETPASAELVVTPARMHLHPGVAKAWVVFSGAGSVGALSAAAVNGVSAITKNGTGDYTITWSVAFSSADYAYSISAEAGASDNVFGAQVKNGGKAAGSLRITFLNGSGAAFDPPSVSVLAFGDQ